MKESKKFLIKKKLLLFLVFVLLNPACEKPNDTLVHSKGKILLSLSNFKDTLKKESLVWESLQNMQPANKIKFLRQALQEEVDKLLLLEEANKRGLTLEEAFYLEKEKAFKSHYREMSFQKTLEAKNHNVDTWTAQKRQRLLLQTLVDHEIGDYWPTEEELKDLYQREQQVFLKPKRIRLRHLVVDSLKKAQELERRLSRGENFANLASLYSMAPEGKSGGDLGLKKVDLLPEALKIAWSLKVGQVSPVIKSPYGYHLVKVLEKKKASQASYSEVRESLVDLAIRLKRQETLKNLSQKLKEGRELEFNWELLKKI